MDDRCVICYDSGTGGRYLYGKIKRAFPLEKTLYFSDLGNMPYGNKTKSGLKEILDRNMRKFLSYSPKAVVIACNTISTVFPDYRTEGGVRIFRVFPEIPKGKKTLLLSTEATAGSFYVKRLIRHRNDVTLCPLAYLAEDIEKGEIDLSRDWEKIEREGKSGFECVSLGCTHYRAAIGRLKRIFPAAEIVDGADRTFSEVSSFLKNNPCGKEGSFIASRR